MTLFMTDNVFFQARKDLKLIVSSATVDAEELQRFFNLSDKGSRKDKDKDTSVILSVSGRTYQLEICFSIGKFE